MKLKRLFLCVLSASGLLCAADLFVAKTGSDANTGSGDAPLATITKAIQMAKPGDTVRLRPGIFSEQIKISKSGTAEAPITIAGTRGENGEYLTIVEGVSKELSAWEPAPEYGPTVWKMPVEKRPDIIMMDGATITNINALTMKLEPWEKTPELIDANMIWSRFGPNCRRLPGLNYLRFPVDGKIKHHYFGNVPEPFWPMIGYVLAGWRDGTLYLRFANDDKPENHAFTAAYGYGFTLQGASYFNFRDMHVRGSFMQFRLNGKSSHNTIENCLLMHGRTRIFLNEAASFTTIRNNIMTSGFLRSELFGMRDDEDRRGGLLYEIYKYIIGTSSSDDIGVKDNGNNTRILDNIITQGLIGIDALGVDEEVAGNMVYKMSSVGICSGPTTVGRFHHNLVTDCGIPLRIHGLREKRVRREEYHYCNLYVQKRNSCNHIFVHSESRLTKDDGINFEPDGTYKLNPPNPVDAGKIYIYHNTFWGGNDKGYPAAFEVHGLSLRFRMSLPFFVFNNIYKDNYRVEPKTHDLPGPNVLYRFVNEDFHKKRLDMDAEKINKVLDFEQSKKIWNTNDLPGLPDLTLAPDSPALEAAIDVSKPFTAFGKDYPALPGFKPGYYTGKAPAAGALQLGESMEHFIEMFRRASETKKMLAELKEKTSAEARRKVSR